MTDEVIQVADLNAAYSAYRRAWRENVFLPWMETRELPGSPNTRVTDNPLIPADSNETVSSILGAADV